MSERAAAGLPGIVHAKQRDLASRRTRLRPGALDGLDQAQRVDITYTSNAIEGNTLTAGETALVLEKGLTIAGKPLRDHLEAVDHAAALDWVLQLATSAEAPIRETDIRSLQALVVATSRPEIGGRYADAARFVNTDRGLFHFPPPVDIPVLMRDFAGWLGNAAGTPETAFAAHRRLVAIHPFIDGNGRTARLLMNLVLVRGGFPPIAVRPEDRPAYISALEIEQAGGGHAAFDDLMYRSLDRTLDIYLDAARQADGMRATAARGED
jgi:Fic family protein